jgi:hypothetical protein
MGGWLFLSDIWDLQPHESAPVTEEEFIIAQEPIELDVSAQITSPLTDAATDRHIIVLHGWGNRSADMTGWVGALKEAGLSANRYLWNLQYDYTKQFPMAASGLMQYFNQQVKAGHTFRDVLFLCYSMGGLVARQMIAQGFPVTRLATVCSPHLGMMYGPAFPGVDLGVTSLKQGSSELNRLNNDPGEGAMRGRYLCASVSYRHANPLGQWDHDDDTAVDGWSARGDSLGALVKRHNVRLNYQGGVGVQVGAPHKEGMNPRWFGSVINFLRE